ncbi:hypothetical protein [Nocardia gamkensis]|uniref:Uncharacterized protein n=1 Tax=Nocardia gamkensis TaxID=352869 RepID=A0A7X6L0V4_9NOCA|nr:hypothetical protein [Nocardia gamkensis]NKY25791.1 hypothetical protein [Nocardia gamkensis]NQE69024.1 hypothetical protein [Nocardia gamkensis]
MIKSGARLESQVCETQVIVIKSTDAIDGLRCGGAPMVPLGEQRDAGAVLDPEFSGGTAVGKRYVHDSGAEILVTRAGGGTLDVDAVPLALKEAKQLPSSD